MTQKCYATCQIHRIAATGPLAFYVLPSQNPLRILEFSMTVPQPQAMIS